jgi:hypothetical protein
MDLEERRNLFVKKDQVVVFTEELMLFIVFVMEKFAIFTKELQLFFAPQLI